MAVGSFCQNRHTLLSAGPAPTLVGRYHLLCDLSCPGGPRVHRGDKCLERGGLAMKRTACLLTSLLVVAMVAGPAAARPVDLVKAGTRLGPIRFFETTLGETKSWFGAPTARRKVRLGCIRAIKARWGQRLLVFFTTTRDHTAIEGEIRRRRLRSKEHGPLKPHTLKGLRVGDGYRKLSRLYPRADTNRHGNHFDHFLRYSPDGGRLAALTKYRKGRVRALFAGPYENC